MTKLTKQLSRLISYKVAVISKQSNTPLALPQQCCWAGESVDGGRWGVRWEVVVVGVCHGVTLQSGPVPTFLSQSAIICNSDFLSDLLSTDTSRLQPPPVCLVGWYHSVRTRPHNRMLTSSHWLTLAHWHTGILGSHSCSLQMFLTRLTDWLTGHHVECFQCVIIYLTATIVGSLQQKLPDTFFLQKSWKHF